MTKNASVSTIFIINCFMRSICFAGAAFLAYHDKAGWGWMIFAGIVTGLSWDADKEDKEND